MFFPYGFDAALNWLDPVNREHPLNAGRVAWWLARPEGMGGPTWRDLMGLNAGTLTNMSIPGTSTSGWSPTTRPGGFGKVAFEGIVDYVEVADAPPLNLDYPFTIALWIKYTDATNRVIFEKNGNAGFTVQTGALVTGGLSLWTGTVGSGRYLTGATNDGGWHRVLFAATAPGLGGITIYLDGAVAPSADNGSGGDSPSYGGSTPIYIGSRRGSFGLAMHADDFPLWSRNLSASEAWADYDESRRGYPGALNRIGPSVFLLSPPAAGASAATFAATLGGASLSSSATFSDPAAFSAALAGVSLAASGLFATPSAFASTLAGASLAATANAAPPGNTAAFAATLAGVGLASSATFASASTFHATLGGVSLVATAGVGAVNVDAAFAATLGGVTLAAAAIYGQIYFEQALTLRLKANTSILATAGGRVFPGMIPQNALLPAVTYLMHSKHRVANLDGKAGIARARVFISAWAHNYADAKSLANGIVADIPIGFTGQLGPGVIITDTFHRSEIDKYHEPSDSSDIGTFQTIFDIRMDYRE